MYVCDVSECMYYIASRAKHHSVQYLPVFFYHPPYEGNVICFFREKFFSKNIFSFNFTFMIIEQLYILNVLLYMHYNFYLKLLFQRVT